MTQGIAKKVHNENEKKSHNKKKEISSRPKRVWKKRKDPIRSALIQKAEAIVMEKALQEPMKGGMKLIKPSEKQAKTASVSTKKLMHDATRKDK